jgi:uncharacterized membrane protein
MNTLAIAGLVFLLIHVLPVTPWRARTVAAIGEGAYLGLFSLVSLIVFALWAWAFEAAPADPRAWTYPLWWPWLKAVIMLLAFVLAVAGISSPNPTLPNAGTLLERPNVASGIFAITRHPVMWAFAIWGIAHFISEPNWRGFWFFGIFAITALGGVYLQERRKARTFGSSWGRFRAKTSFFPFVALMQGRASLRLGDIGWWRIALAVLLWALLLHFHTRLFGVAPLPGLHSA